MTKVTLPGGLTVHFLHGDKMKIKGIILFVVLLLLALALNGCCGCDDDKEESVVPPTCETNLAPVALIATPVVENVVAGQDVVLDGSRSYDEDLCPNGQIVLYHWELMSTVPTDAVDVASFVFSNNDTPTAKSIFFRAPERRSTLMVQLTVFDGELWSEPVSASINMYNAPPVAAIDTSEGTQVVSGTSVVLTGEGSDVDGDPITYLWEQTGGPEVNFDDPTIRTPTIDIPYNFSETFTVSLTVNDGMVDSIPATATFQIFRRDRDHTLFVRRDGDDVYNSGYKNSPYATVARALEVAALLDEPADVIVAAGEYNEDTLVLPDNASIFGGFSPTNWNRDITTYDSVLKHVDDTANTQIYCATPEPFLRINGNSAAFIETRIDGLTIKGRNFCQGFLVAGLDQYTIWITGGADPVISNNLIYAGYPDLGFVDYRYTVAINVGAGEADHADVNEPLIYNNLLFGGQGDWQTYGMAIGGRSRPKVYNNTILSGQVRQKGMTITPDQAQGRSVGIIIWDTGNANADILNNLIYLNMGSYPERQYRFGVIYIGEEMPFGIDRFKNNDIFIPFNISPQYSAYYIYTLPTPGASEPYTTSVAAMDWLTTIDELNALGETRCENNFNFDPYLLDFDPESALYPDYHIPATSPIVDIGLELSDDVPFDYDGESRGNDGNGDSTAGYDIGYDEVTP